MTKKLQIIREGRGERKRAGEPQEKTRGTEEGGGEAGEVRMVRTDRAWEESSKVQSAKMKGSCGS